MPTIITCPSSLKGEVRGFKAKEANLLADRVALKKGIAFEGILAGCWLNTVDPGPYSWLNGGPVDWSKVLVCDRFWTMLKIRAATYGDEYSFKVQCQNGMCGETIEWELNLSDLPVKELPQSSIDILKAGENKFETTLDDGLKCWFKLQDGAGEMAAANILRASQSQLIVAALSARILEIEGVDSKKPALKRAYLENMEMRELMRLLDIFDEADGGVSTDIDVECPKCGTVQQVSLPLGRDFFLPRAKKKSTTTATHE
ncbi:MAG: hypothetical protein EPO57_09100 [Chitinophagaceae bacterium]|nr:MAG: hypothetical protein EPO57_09100 [Chitinophagaceae bacterium]